MQSDNLKKRFIAGAVCPQCGLMDKIVVYAKENTEFCECVRCGYQQQQTLEQKPIIAKFGKKEQIIRVRKPVKK